MILSDSPFINTGYSTICLNIANKLHDLGYDITYLGQAIPHSQKLPMLPIDRIVKVWKEMGIDVKYDKNINVPSVYFEDGTPLKFNLIGQSAEPYCKDIIQPWIKTIRPDIFLTLLDTFMVFPWWMDIDFSPAKSVFYYPTDGIPFLPGGVCDNILRKCSKAIAMSKFGQQQVKNYHKLDTGYIPHAIDINLYRPLNEIERQNIKIKYGILNKFVVGCVARNQPRKMLDRTIKAFALFSKEKEDVVLVLHLDPLDKAAIFDMNILIKELNIANKVLYTGTRYFNGFTYNEMVEVYNMFDVFCLLTSGEGFGIPFIEAMGCEIPIICTDYTTGKELVIDDGRCGELVKIGESDIEIMNTLTGNWNVERAIADINDGAEKLNKLYYNKDLRYIYGKEGRRKVMKYYNWENVIPQWDRLFKNLMDE